MTPALIAAFAIMTAATPAAAPDDAGGEPLPPGAPTDSYELAAWCYGALNEYLLIYDHVKPDLRAIDTLLGGDQVRESEPYQSDMAAARVELKVIGESVTQAEQASPRPISDRGVAAMHQGQGVWAVAEARPERELARAWLMWALPDRCDSNARDLSRRSILLGKALSYNAGQHAQAPAATAPRVTAPAVTALSAASTALAPHPSPATTPPAAMVAAPPPAEPPALAAQAAATEPQVTPMGSSPPAMAMTATSSAAPVAAAAAPATESAPATQPTEPQATAPAEPGPPPREPVTVTHDVDLPPPAPQPVHAQATAPTISPPGVDEPQEPTL
jgi:hypothetical protein